MTTLTPGQEIGPYRVIEQVGKGGMATVYKAHHAAMDRYVAIKILPFQFAQDKEFNDRFRREVRVIAKLEHPRILPVYDSGDFDGTPYLVMRYLDAGTLKEHIQTRKMSLDEIDRIFTQLTDALAYAHSHEIVHRDIKPSNVMLTRQGDVFLTDFGIAKLVGEHTQFTASGAITGTPAYMSPEQAEGGTIDARADVYALGIVLYEMVTGRVPFEAETPLAVILKHLQAPLPPPSTLVTVHPAVEQVIFKALARNRDDRYPSTLDLQTAWKNAVQIAQSEKSTLAGKPAPAVMETQAVSRATVVGQTGSAGVSIPRGATTPPIPPARNRRTMFWIGGGLAGIVLLGICVFAVISLFKVCCAPPGPDPNLLSASEPPTSSGAEPEQTLVTNPLPFPENGTGTWESWTGSGIIFSVAFRDGMIYAGGLGGITVFDENWNFIDQMTVQDGLPDNRVFYLFTDEEEDNDLWAATSSGVARYNGENWTVYGYEDGLDDTNVNFVSRVGEYIVAGTAYGPDGGGINLFDGQGWTQLAGFDSSANDDPNKFDHSVWEAVKDEATNTIWVATENGLGAFDGETWTRYTTDDGLPSNFITGVMLDDNNTLLVSTESGAARFGEKRFEVLGPTQDRSINDIVVDSNGNYWFTSSGAVLRYNPDNGNWGVLEGGNDFPSYTSYRAIADEAGNVFIGTDGDGVVAFDGVGFTKFVTPPGPSGMAYWNALQSPDGNLWFLEEYGQGIAVYNPSQDTWDSKDLGVCCVIPLAFDNQGNGWGGGDTGVWILHPDGTSTNLTMDNGLPTNQVYDVSFAGDGVTWLATDSGLVKLQGEEFVEVINGEAMGITNSDIRTLFAASDGSVWVGREGGLSHLKPDGTWEQFGVGTLFTGDFSRVNRIAEHPDGSLWVTTNADGIFQNINGQWKHYTPTDPGVALPTPAVNSVSFAPDGSIWFATEAGAARFDGQNWTSWELKDGLSHWNINSVYVQDDGTVWFMTSGGITRWRP